MSTGGSYIDSYEIQYDKGTSGNIMYSLAGGDTTYSLDTSIIVTGLSSSTNYLFRVRAHSEMGWG